MRALVRFLFVTLALATLTPQVLAQTPSPASSSSKRPTRPEYPPFSEVSKGYTKVVSNLDAAPGLYTLWKRTKDGQMLAELPRSYATDKYFFAMTVNSGETYAGLQSGERYLTWRRYDKRLALIEPNISIRSTGEKESKDSVSRLFTDSVVLDVPILCLGPSKTPVIDLDALLVGQASKFFPSSARGANPRLAKIKTAKSFPKNIEVSFEVPTLRGQLKTLHYSISKIPTSTGYKPRKADERVGYFTTSYTDLGKYKRDETKVRYINRWHLEKADPSLKLSPPKQPIVFLHRTHHAKALSALGEEGNPALEQGVRKDRYSRRDRRLPTRFQPFDHSESHGKRSGGRSLQLRSLAEQQRGYCDWSQPSPSDDGSDS